MCKERRKRRTDEAVCHVSGLALGVGWQAKGDPAPLGSRTAAVFRDTLFHLELPNDSQKHVRSPSLGRRKLFVYALRYRL